MNRDGASPQPAVKPGPGLFVAAVMGLVAASAGCSTSTNTPTPASTPTVHETTSPQSTVIGPNANPATATANPTFVGHWHVHGATMDISPATATIVASNGPCGPGAQGMCHETDTLTVSSGDSAQLTLKVTAVTYADSSGASAPNPSPGPPTAVGDTLQLTPQAPGLLKATILRGFPAWVGGNPYWCGQGVSPSDAKRCGA
jgi:hypothetical protein